MKKFFGFLMLLLCAAVLLGANEPKLPSMPAAVSSNAVASLKNGLELFSLMGVGPKKAWDDITNQVYIMLLGGYVVDGQGGEMTVADVNLYSPLDRRWYSGKEIPVPVDSAVVGVFRDRYVSLIGGRSNTRLVNNVQVYDAEKDSWSQATPLPGTPVFGHAGGLADDTVVYVDGAMRGTASGAPYVASAECWLGKIDRKDPTKIEWSKLPAHPGPAHFGIAAGEKEHKVLFSGGAASPHNFKGVGYDG